MGNLSPAYWAKGSSSTNARPAARPVWEGDCPGVSGAGAAPWSCVPLAKRPGRRACVFNLLVCKNKYTDCSLRKNRLLEQALPEKVLEAKFLLILWLGVRPSSRNYLGTRHSVGSVIST